MDPLALDQYYKKFSRDLVGYDEAENSARINYASALDTVRRNKRRDLQSLSGGIADRGMTHSGIGLQQGLDMNEAYDRNLGTITANQNATLAKIARRRLETEADMNEVRAYG